MEKTLDVVHQELMSTKLLYISWPNPLSNLSPKQVAIETAGGQLRIQSSCLKVVGNRVAGYQEQKGGLVYPVSQDL